MFLNFDMLHLTVLLSIYTISETVRRYCFKLDLTDEVFEPSSSKNSHLKQSVQLVSISGLGTREVCVGAGVSGDRVGLGSSGLSSPSPSPGVDGSFGRLPDQGHFQVLHFCLFEWDVFAAYALLPNAELLDPIMLFLPASLSQSGMSNRSIRTPMRCVRMSTDQPSLPTAS